MFHRNKSVNSYSTIIQKNDIIYHMSMDSYDNFEKLITEMNVNNIIDSKNGYTALHYAIKLNNENMMEYLLNMGADPYLKTLTNEDAFDISLKYQSKFVISHKLNDLKENSKELQKTISIINKENNDFNINNKYLLKTVDELIIKNNLLKVQVIDLNKEKTCKNNSLFKKNSTLLISLESSITENDSLKNDKENLKTEFKSLKRKYDSLDESYSGLLSKFKRT
jgi:ankyrin repeat protein